MEIGIIVFLVLCIICAFRESKLTGTYKTLGIFGRVKAYLAMDLTFAGLLALVASIIVLVSPGKEIAGIEAESGFATLLVGAVCAAIGILLYVTTARKCPPSLRKRVIIDMIAVGLGVTMKITLFFLGFVWKITMPEVYTDSNGKPYYVYIEGEVYDAETGRYGRLGYNADGSKYVEF